MKSKIHNISKAWDWNKDNNNYWFIPCEESFYLIDRWKQKKFKKLLDLGCGRGRHSIQFAQAGFNVDSLDLSNTAVNDLNKWADKENLNIKAVVGDMLNLPFKDNTFDCLIAYHVISHTDSKGIIKILSEIRRVLKNNGELFVTFGSKNAWGFKDAGFPKLDDNTIIKKEEGPENNIPHFYVDEKSINKLLSKFKVVTLKQVQDVILEGYDSLSCSWHYYVLAKK